MMSKGFWMLVGLGLERWANATHPQTINPNTPKPQNPKTPRCITS